MEEDTETPKKGFFYAVSESSLASEGIGVHFSFPIHEANSENAEDKEN